VTTRQNLLKQAVLRSLKSAREAATDYVGIAIAYAEDAIADRRGEKYCDWIRLAARRFIKDLKRAAGKRPPFNWSPSRANLHCEFIEELHHVEGTWSSPTLRLLPFQCFFVCQLFGFRNHLGGRRFSTALLLIARKNAKSTLAAAILLSCLCLEPEQGPQVISAATTGQQAKAVFNAAKRMVERNQELREVYALEPFSKSIARYENGGSFAPINAKASTQDGLNPSHTVMDEVHAHKTADLLNVLTSAAGGRDNPLWLYTTTEGYETPGPWPELRGFAQNILKGVIVADHFLAVLFTLDENDDDYDESRWIKANPLMETSRTLLLKVREAAIEAKQMASKAAEFRIKRCNRRSATATGWVSLNHWRKCKGPIDVDSLIGYTCYGAIDLASTGDMNSLVWLFELGDDRYASIARYWVPADAVDSRTERKSVNYAGWVESGLIKQTTGNVADYAVIFNDLMEDYQRFNPRMIAYDPYNASTLVNQLTEQGVPMQMFIQGAKSYHPAMQAFERAYKSGKLVHDGNAVLTWNMANLVPRYDANMNTAPDKRRSADKIDGACAQLMCFGLAELGRTSGDEAGFYSSPIILR
jgi:phage terminase large subunit-like protein